MFTMNVSREYLRVADYNLKNPQQALCIDFGRIEQIGADNIIKYSETIMSLKDNLKPTTPQNLQIFKDMDKNSILIEMNKNDLCFRATYFKLRENLDIAVPLFTIYDRYILKSKITCYNSIEHQVSCRPDINPLLILHRGILKQAFPIGFAGFFNPHIVIPYTCFDPLIEAATFYAKSKNKNFVYDAGWNGWGSEDGDFLRFLKNHIDDE